MYRNALRLILLLWAAPAFTYYAMKLEPLWAGLNLVTLIIVIFMWNDQP